VAISTSFDRGEKRYSTDPKDGFYRIDFGDRRVGRITIYVDGKVYRTIEVKDVQQLNIVLP
jgi:hypothetical protein